MVGSGTSGTEPCSGVAAGNHVLLDTESGDIETVDNVLRSQNHLDVASNGHVQFVNFAMAFFGLEFPHPLFCHHVDLGSSARRLALLEKVDRAPHEDDHENSEWHDRQGDVHDHVALNLLAGE